MLDKTLTLLRALVCVVGCLGVYAAGQAQTIAPEHIESIDASVLNSSHVVVGHVESYETDGKDTATKIRLSVSEVLKGDSTGQLQADVRTSAASVQAWKSSEASLLVAAGSTAPFRHVSLIDLGAKIRVPRADFGIIDNKEQLLTYIRDLSKSEPGVEQIGIIGLRAAGKKQEENLRAVAGGRYAELDVPADERLHKRALQEISSSDPEVRIQGAEMLTPFNGPDSLQRLSKLLKDPAYKVVIAAENDEGIERGYFPVRDAAQKILRQWHANPGDVEISREVSKLSTIHELHLNGQPRKTSELLEGAKQLESLDFDNASINDADLRILCTMHTLRRLVMPMMGVTDEKLEQLAALKNLTSLSLDRNPISDEGLQRLAKIKNLKELSVNLTEVTDEGLAKLRRERPDMAVTPAKAAPALALYAEIGNLAGAKRLLHNFPATAGDYYGVDPLHGAAYDRQTEMVKLLLDHGAPVNGLDSELQTPLQAALIYYEPKFSVLTELLGRGADVNNADKSGTTPLAKFLSMGNNDRREARLLLSCGADTSAFRSSMTSISNLQMREFLQDYINLQEHPIPLVFQTKADCTHDVYEPSLAKWSTQPLGRLTGPLQWSRSPSGREYVGPFGQQAVILKLDHLPPHKNVHVEVELFVIGSWDGNGGLAPGPDLIDIDVQGVGRLLHSTFFNNGQGDMQDLPMQSFPDEYPFGFHKGFTGAAETGSLGFPDPRNAVYKLSYTFSDPADHLELVLTGNNVVDDSARVLTDDENWGIGGLVVKVD